MLMTGGRSSALQSLPAGRLQAARAAASSNTASGARTRGRRMFWNLVIMLSAPLAGRAGKVGFDGHVAGHGNGARYRRSQRTWIAGHAPAAEDVASVCPEIRQTNERRAIPIEARAAGRRSCLIGHLPYYGRSSAGCVCARRGPPTLKRVALSGCDIRRRNAPIQPRVVGLRWETRPSPGRAWWHSTAA